MRKKRFIKQRRSKLMLRGDGSFQILERINDNVCKVNLLNEYSVSITFNIFYIFLFNVDGDSRSNPFKDMKDYAIQTTPNDILEV
jgi:hypothetical protein